jgi:hypothetical protein
MRTIAWMGVVAACLVACEKQPDAPALAVVSVPTATAAAPAPAAATAVPSASATAMASAVPADPPTSEETVFWQALALVYDSHLPECKGGWTGDGEITIKDGKIARFTIDEHTGKPLGVPSLKGKAVPPIPASLKKMFEKPVAISVCTGGHRPPAE